MMINANFEERVVVHAAARPWLASPVSGVERRPLDRVGGETARATSIVRYQPGSTFPAHRHTGGEEYLVLDGVFEDENGRDGPGTYVRNPPGSCHAPRAPTGCTIFVKLWQFEPGSNACLRLDTTRFWAEPGTHRLFEDDSEAVYIVNLARNQRVVIETAGGAELLVLEGEVSADLEDLVRWSWLRQPGDSPLTLTASGNGAVVWLKQRHLARANAQIQRLRAFAEDPRENR